MTNPPFRAPQGVKDAAQGPFAKFVAVHGASSAFSPLADKVMINAQVCAILSQSWLKRGPCEGPTWREGLLRRALSWETRCCKT